MAAHIYTRPADKWVLHGKKETEGTGDCWLPNTPDGVGGTLKIPVVDQERTRQVSDLLWLEAAL